jgi:hypothetical protein
VEAALRYTNTAAARTLTIATGAWWQLPLLLASPSSAAAAYVIRATAQARETDGATT